MAKFSHKQVNYGPGHRNGDHCAVCERYEPPHCEIVADPIKPLGWCEKFKAISKELSRRLEKR